MRINRIKRFTANNADSTSHLLAEHQLMRRYTSVLFIVIMCALLRPSVADSELLILHNNDLRARIEENRNKSGHGYGGFGRIAHIVKEARRMNTKGKGPPVLYLYAGDMYTEPVWRNPSGANLAVEFLNILQPDAACFGEHDLADDKIENLYGFVKKIQFPLTAANLHFPDKSYLSHKLQRSIMLHANNIRVGIVGYVSSANAHFLPNNTSVRFEDETSAIRRECKALRKNGANIIIALGYAGLSTDKRIAENVQDIDVVIGGLTNNFLWNGPEPNTEIVEDNYPIVVVQKSGKRVPVAQTYGFSKYVGRLLLKLDSSNRLIHWRGNPIFLHNEVPTDDVITRVLTAYKGLYKQIREEDAVLGQSIVPLTSENNHNSESNLANFVTDSILEFAIAKKHVRPSSFALINAGAFKGKIATSRNNPNITRKMIEEVVPCYHKLVYVRIQGSYIKQAIEDGVSKTDRNSFIHGSGIRFDLDLNAPKDERVKSIRTLCVAGNEPRYCKLDSSKDYRFITTAYFLTQGGHDNLRYQGSSTALAEEVIDAFIYAFDTFGSIRPEHDNRIYQYRRGQATKKKDSSVGHIIFIDVDFYVFCFFNQILSIYWY